MERAPKTAKPTADESAADRPPALEPRKRSKRSKRNPELEVVFGARIRAARVAARMSQTVLGEAVGISFQQMQKYEKGTDRVAASTLQAIATALDLHPGSFFDGDSPSLTSSPKPGPRSAMGDLRSAQRIGERIERLGNPFLIRRLLALVEAIENAMSDAFEDDGRTSDDDEP